MDDMLEQTACDEARTNAAAQPLEAEGADKDHVASVPERIEQLLRDMGAQKRQLIAIMDFCRQERTSDEIDEMLKPFMEHRHSVYGPIAMRSLLEKAGALEYRANDEAPETVADENGDLVLPQPAVATWVSTAEAVELCDADDPYAELIEALDNADGPAEAYAFVLALCDDEGQSVTDIGAQLESSGVLEGVTYDPTFFISKLEDIEALEWRGDWYTTDLGRRYLARVSG